MTKEVYMYDQTSREFKGSKSVDDNYVVQAGETEIKPTDGLYEPVIFMTDDATAWIGTDKAVWQAAQDAANQEYLKEHPEEAPQPTAEQQQLADLIKGNAQQTALNAQLIKQITTLQARITVSQQTVQTTNANTTQEAE